LRPVRYWIFDIPPALAVAEWYLSRTLREKKLFRWRPFDQWSSVSREVEEADIAIFSIDQLRLVPDRTISTFSAISSLHEMTRATCTEVVRLMGLKARNAIYTKNWIEWRNLDDRMRFSSSELDPPKGWRTVFDRTDDVIADFNEKLFVRSG
jgi:hypothetical protein